MSTGQTEPLILAIGSGDNFLHVYQNDQELVVNAGPGELSGPIEFFDSDGHRLAGVYDQKWQLLVLTPTTSQPDLPALLKRVWHTIDPRLRSFLEENPEESEEFNTEAKDILAQLPRLHTAADLREFLQTFFTRSVLRQARIADSPLVVPFGPNAGPESGPGKVVFGHGGG